MPDDFKFEELIGLVNSCKIDKTKSISANKPIYEFLDRNITIYTIRNYEDCKKYGHENWCILVDPELYKMYADYYRIWIIDDKSRDKSDSCSKVCYLKSDIEDMFVTIENIHYYSDSGLYMELAEYYGDEILSVLK